LPTGDPSHMRLGKSFREMVKSERAYPKHVEYDGSR
jgi:hypothetical protein